jgi:hypothetical protein
MCLPQVGHRSGGGSFMAHLPLKGEVRLDAPKRNTRAQRFITLINTQERSRSIRKFVHYRLGWSIVDPSFPDRIPR